MSTRNHIGRKVARIRELRDIKQEFVATGLGISQQTFSRMEQSEEIEDHILDKIADILGVTREGIKNFSEDAVINIINSTLHDNAGSVNNNCSINFNPLDKYVEAMDAFKAVVEENKNLYERLLASEREKTEILQRQR